MTQGLILSVAMKESPLVAMCEYPVGPVRGRGNWVPLIQAEEWGSACSRCLRTVSGDEDHRSAKGPCVREDDCAHTASQSDSHTVGRFRCAQFTPCARGEAPIGRYPLCDVRPSPRS